MLVSIIMSTYNETEEYLRMSIESILAQSYFNFEYIIVLDNPENKLIESIVREYESKDSRIKVIKNKKNIGLTKSLNKAISYSKGNYIARMDADDIAYPNRIEEQVEYLVHNGLDIVGSRVMRIDAQGKVIQEQSNHPIDPEIIRDVLKYDNCVAHPTWLLKKDVMLILGGYRSLLANEDYDFLLRARNEGFKIGNHPQVLLAYRIHDVSISQSNALDQFLITIFLQKNLNNLDNINTQKIDEFLKGKSCDIQRRKFNKSQLYFQAAIKMHNEGKLMKVLTNLAQSVLSSKYFVIKMKNILMLRVLKLKYGIKYALHKKESI